MSELQETGSSWPCGPCSLPLKCSRCGTVLTEENVVDQPCADDCEVCQYCSSDKCPTCGEHVCCGGCI